MTIVILKMIRDWDIMWNIVHSKKKFETLVIELGLALLEGRHLAPPAETILPPPPYLKGKQGVLAS